MAWRHQPRSESDQHDDGTKDKEHLFTQWKSVSDYPATDPRERDSYWGRPGAHYSAHFSRPPARPEQFPYKSGQYAYGYGWPEQQRALSTHGYDYPHHSYWDYRNSYAYYGFYGGQHSQHDDRHRDPQEFWRTSQYHERTNKQEHAGTPYTDDYRYDQGGDSSRRYPTDNENNLASVNDEGSSYYLGTLESSKNSGLSSSSYELSQYMDGRETSDSKPRPVSGSHEDHGPLSQVSVPLKYSIPHVVVSFGPWGQLIRVTPSLSVQESVSRLEIHSMEIILSETQEQQDMRNFPGPLTREALHKVNAIKFADQKVGEVMRDEKLLDKMSAALLWNQLILLCRQNGQIVGSDIAELLMQESHSDGGRESDAPALIDFDEDMHTEAPPTKGDDLLTGDVSKCSPESPDKALQNYTQLLLAGRKKEALESAMNSSLWGHALFLASKIGNRSYSTVLNRFTAQLAASDPLQTLFQLLSGRIPAVSTCCGNEKWRDWRPHLAVMLSNETGNPALQQKAIITMGDSLASRGLIHAAHLCYLTASVPFGVFTRKAERLVLLGSSHRQSFKCFATNSAIQCTELYEYCMTIRDKCFSIPSFQVYKFLYASRLLDCGFSSKAFHYCEVIGQTILGQREPHIVLMGEVIKLSDRLRYKEGLASEAGFRGADEEPEWLKHLHAKYQGLRMESYNKNEKYQPAPASDNYTFEESKEYPVPDVDDLSFDIQSPEMELLYYRDSEDQERFVGQTGENSVLCGDRGAQDCPYANHPVMPVTVTCAPPALTVAPSQNFSYHNTDSAERRSNLSNVSSATEEAELASEAGKMLAVNISHYKQSQQVMPQAAEGTVEASDFHKQNRKAGWFSGWFKAKPKDVAKENSEQGCPAETVKFLRILNWSAIINVWLCLILCVHFLPRSHHPILV